MSIFSRHRRVFFVGLMLSLVVMQAFALAAGNLVGTSFGNAGPGWSQIDFGDVGDIAYDLVLQSDNKIILAGSTFNGANDDFALTRFNTDGTLDTTFGVGGYVRTDFNSSNDYARAIVLQSDGKIVVAGYTTLGGDNNVALARYSATGVLDTTFDGDGKVVTEVSTTKNDEAYDVKIDANGKIVIGGNLVNSNNYDDILFARYLSNGSLDSSFATAGIYSLQGNYWGIYGLVIDSASKIVGITNRGYVFRLDSTGTLDTTFSGDGRLDIGEPGRDILLYPGGKYVVVARNFFSSTPYVVRLNNNGTYDTTFDSNGDARMNTTFDYFEGRSGVVDTAGNIIVVGEARNDSNAQDFSGVIARFTSAGNTDITFSGDGWSAFGTGTGDDRFKAVALTSDNRLLVAGQAANNNLNSNFLAVKYLNEEVLPPGNFGLISPANNTSFGVDSIPNPVSFSWQTSSSAQSYRLTVHRDTTSNTALIDRQIVGTSYNLTSEERALLSLGTYVWTVSATSGGGTTAASAVNTFTVSPVIPGTFALTSPANNTNYLAGSVPNPVAFAWQSATSAVSYRLQIFVTGGITPLIEKQGLTATDYTLTSPERDLLTAGSYYWTVTAFSSSGGTRNASANHNFSITPPNLLLNAGFEIAGANPKTAAGWTGVKLVSTRDRRICNTATKTHAIEGSCAFRMKAGVLTSGRVLKQTVIPANVVAGDSLVISAQVRRMSLNGNARIRVRVMSGTTTLQTLVLPIPSGSGPYALAMQSTTLIGTPTSMIISIEARSTTGTFYVDDLSLSSISSRLREGTSLTLPEPSTPEGWRN